MKIFKMLFSKTAAVVLAVMLQIVLIAVTAMYFSTHYAAVQIACSVIGLLALCHLINRKQTPEFTVAWMFLLLVIPLFGTVLYLLFANPRLTPWQAKRLSGARERSEPYIRREQAAEVPEIADGYEGIAHYLTSQTRLPPYKGNRTAYFASGEEFFADLKRELARAEKFIFLEYFIIAPGKMWDEIHEILLDRVRAGVEVRVMYDDMGTLGKLRSSYAKKLRREGIDACKFNPCRPLVSGVYNNRDHRKITVIDGRVGYTGGLNLADEYINEIHPFGHWKDTAVKIEGSAVRGLTLMFLQLFDGTAKRLSDFSRYLDTEAEVFDEAGFVQPFYDSPRPLDSDQIGENVFLNMAGAAKKFLYVSTPYLIPDYNLLTAIANAAKRGVDVRLITPHIPDKKTVFRITRSNYAYLMRAGVRIYEYTPGFIHAKGWVADGEAAFVGTVNLDYRSLVHHFECGVMLYGTPSIADICADFEKTFAASQEMTPENCKQGRLPTLGGAILNVFSPML